MKKLRLILIFVTLFFMKASFTSAQVSLSFNINSQPLWGPVSYDHVEYYYLPEYEMYYYAPRSQFIYLNGNKWVYSNSLPYQYRNADLYRTYKVVINEPKPYLRNDHYTNNYKQYKNEHSKQEIIRDSHDSKYTIRKNHPNHSKFKASPINYKNTRSDAQKSGNNNTSKKKDKKQGKK